MLSVAFFSITSGHVIRVTDRLSRFRCVNGTSPTNLLTTAAFSMYPEQFSFFLNRKVHPSISLSPLLQTQVAIGTARLSRNMKIMRE
jgi:hypothetical protein